MRHHKKPSKNSLHWEDPVI